MTKLLQNKSIIKFLGIALSILLIVALVPQINIAYGSKDDVATDPTTEETTDPSEAEEAAEQPLADTEGVEEESEGDMPSGGIIDEAPTPDDESGIMATALSEENLTAVAETPADTTSKALANNTSQTIDGDVTNTSSPLTFSGNKTYTLTVKGTLHSDIKVSGGAKLLIDGTGTIIGKGDAGQGSVIVVEGKGTKLTFAGPTVKGGTGREIPNVNRWVVWGKVGGGIHVCRAKGNTSAENASLELVSGTIENNTANAGGGIFIDNQCGFTMSGGTVQNNTALSHEGGGIFIWGNWNGKTGKDEKKPYCHIIAGKIINNKTETTTDWGGGGIYINNEAILQIDSAQITKNTAESLGGGVAGCPHAKIGIGEIANGAAVFQNTAKGGVGPANSGLKFNMPDSITYPGKKVPSGDFLIQGLTSEEIKALAGSNDATELEYGSTGYKTSPGTYAKDAFDSKLAQDFYCTYASFVGATNLKDHPKDANGTSIAWNGFIAGISADKVAGKKVKEEDGNGSANWHASTVAVPVDTSYEVHDATLCLTSTAKEDKSRIVRKVDISGNTSKTHGGGVACNGTLQFGTYPQQEEIVNNYTLGLTKKVLNGITGESLPLSDDDRFTFTLTDENGNTYTAVSDEKGQINFTNLPGLKASTTKKFTLKETDAKGLSSSVPQEGIQVVVQLNVESSSVTYGNMTTTTYTTTVSSVQIGDVATDTVTNTLNLKASASIPVTKIAEDIAANAFTFGLKDVTGSIGDLVNISGEKVVLKGDVDLAEQTQTSPDKTVTIEVDDSTGGEASATDEEAFTFNYEPKAAEETHWYAIAEQPGTTAGVVYDTTAYLVKITTTVAEGGRSLETSKSIYRTDPNSAELQEVTGAIGVTFTNVATPKGTWQFRADKFFYGLGDPRDCSFTMQEIERVPEAGEPLMNVLVTNDNLQQWTASVKATDFEDSRADIVFPKITYEYQGEGEGFQNDLGDHYYLVTEDGDDAAKDTTAYVIKVNVALDDADPRNLSVTETVRGYADDLSSPLNPLVLPEGERPAFYNTDTYNLISAASYSVYAASGEPVDQVCYVDPKIVKNLEGRAIKSGEFAFKLIQVANYNDTEGELISATTNDEFGMVDFDKANNVSGDLENPSCLAYTKPGTYYYRVIEDRSKGGMNDQSVLYSDQVITFTTVIKQDEETGQLVCADMYYGWWDAASNQNVRFDEQYTDYETQPANIGDMSKLNPDWHPTIINKARPMDLQVRKTSVSDRDEGLVGATYALYMVNENPQGDIWLAEATSEEGGWITYKNVSLATNNLYYFKETAAPAGHTVSEFRSPYFYLVEDATSPNGYTLKYTDTKYFDADAAEATLDAAEAEAADEMPMVAAEAQALQADVAAQAETAAADDAVQPGHSADGNILLTYDKDGGVYDETTQVEVNKLDTRTHEWVEGAKLVILEKESGTEVASWTSGKAPEKLEKTLNVGTTYLLREVEAPGEYRLANDVEFVIDDYGNVTITKGTENGNAELSDNTITLYDTMMDAEEVEQRERETTREVPLGTLLAQTGDMLPLLGLGLVVLGSLIALAVAARRRRTGKDGEN